MTKTRLPKDMWGSPMSKSERRALSKQLFGDTAKKLNGVETAAGITGIEQVIHFDPFAKSKRGRQ